MNCILVVAENREGLTVKEFASNSTTEAEQFCTKFLADNFNYDGRILHVVIGTKFKAIPVEVATKIELRRADSA